MHRIWIALAAIVALVAVGAAGATFIGSGSGTEEFAASFDAQAIGDPEITARPGPVGPNGRKIEAKYFGTFETETDNETGTDNYYDITLTLELRLIDGDASLGSAEGRWTLTRTDGSGRVVARGELVAVAKGPSGDTRLHGMLMGVEFPPGLPERTLLANFSASLTDDFRSVAGAMGGQQLEPNPAVLHPPDDV